MWDSNNVILLYFMTFFHRPTRLENYLTCSNLRIAKHSLQSKNKEKLLWIWKLQISNSVMVQQVKLLLATQAFHIWVSFCSTSVHLPADMPGNAEKEPNTWVLPPMWETRLSSASYCSHLGNEPRHEEFSMSIPLSVFCLSQNQIHKHMNNVLPVHTSTKGRWWPATLARGLRVQAWVGGRLGA